MTLGYSDTTAAQSDSRKPFNRYISPHWQNKKSIATHLEIQLLLENVVQKTPVLARGSLVDAVIGAHDAADASLDRLGERPKLVFVEGAIVNVRRISFASTSTAKMLLLVEGATSYLSVPSPHE